MTASNQLGEFLRARRSRLRPADVGLPSGAGLRRTPGLRREELAAIAGLSIDYYIRLEQGKETNPSGPILDGLARALQLNEEEQAHLRALEADHPDDQDLRELIAELLAGSPEFARLWRRHDVRHRRGDRKPFRHPQIGEFTLTFEVLYLEGGQRMTIYQAAPGSRDHDAVTLLSMIANGEQAPRRLPSPGRPPA